MWLPLKESSCASGGFALLCTMSARRLGYLSLPSAKGAVEEVRVAC